MTTEEPEDRNPESESEESSPSAGGANDSPPAAGREAAAEERGPAEVADEPSADSESEVSDSESARAPSDSDGEAAESPPADSEGETTDTTEEEVYEPAPREKPEIPGADLEPVFIPQEDDQYLDAEARAAAEAEAEAAAARAAAEAEAEQQIPIADAAIDLAAGARYTATGKRKTAVARVILRPGSGAYTINGRPLEAYFPRETLRRVIRLPLETVGYDSRMDVVARMHGGGVSAQAGALRHGIARALIEADPNLRGELKRRGYLTRDPRVKERKKAGLKKARKRPQFSKR